MRITALSRGGLAVHGGHYSARHNQAVAIVRDGETLSVAIDYPSAPSSVTTSESGLTCSTPATSGSQLSCTLSDLTDGGYVDITATVGGAIRIVRIRAVSYTTIDRYDCGDEYVGA